jgi:hypothetical protein
MHEMLLKRVVKDEKQLSEVIVFINEIRGCRHEPIAAAFGERMGSVRETIGTSKGTYDYSFI